MKRNTNRTNDNTMARAFGPEFNYNTEEIVNIIRKMYKLESIGLDFNPIEIEVALLNYDYYVRPGESRERFMMGFYKTVKGEITLVGISDEKKEGFERFFRTIAQLRLIKTFFDKAYFEEQVKRRTSTTSIESKRELRMYLKKLTRDKLEDFLKTLVHYRLGHAMFVSEVSSVGFWDKIHKLCRAAGVKLPEDLNTTEGAEFFSNNPPDFFFDALNLKTIAEMLCDAIDLDIEIASNAAEKLYNVGYDDMITYIDSKIAS